MARPPASAGAGENQLYASVGRPDSFPRWLGARVRSPSGERERNCAWRVCGARSGAFGLSWRLGRGDHAWASGPAGVGKDNLNTRLGTAHPIEFTGIFEIEHLKRKGDEPWRK